MINIVVTPDAGPPGNLLLALTGLITLLVASLAAGWFRLRQHFRIWADKYLNGLCLQHLGFPG
ncbi:hypothetical protein ACLSSQ_13040 [Azospira sp. APE16]|uniref:hypothetical protein n=1 Tax=Azospira sp. APE16 TaxID=3394231 RepID=UPI003A4D52B2